MHNTLRARAAIYDQFHGSSAGPAYFFLPANADAYAGYYTSMYLIQDTGEAIEAHLSRDFSPEAMLAYIEFWGVLQALEIQQDAIAELYRVVVGGAVRNSDASAWMQLREIRHLCAGHPAKRSHGVVATQRTFLGRSFGKYDAIQYEMWDAGTEEITHPVFNLRLSIANYDLEASDVLGKVLNAMELKWL